MHHNSPICVPGCTSVSIFSPGGRSLIIVVVVVVVVVVGVVVDASPEMRGQNSAEGGRGLGGSFATFRPRIHDLLATLLELWVEF